MRHAVLLAGCAALVAACNKAPEINEKNASIEQVADKVRDSGAELFFNPGKWQTKVTVVEMNIPGMPASMQGQIKQGSAGQQSTVGESCLTPEEAKRPGGKFVSGNESKNCRYERFTMAGGKIDAVMRCEGGDRSTSMVMTVVGTYTPNSSMARVEMQVSGGSHGSMAIKAVAENRRIGECTGNET